MRFPSRVERLLAYVLIVILGTIGFWRAEGLTRAVNQARIEADRQIETERIRADLFICHQRNQSIQDVNAKFAELNNLFDASIKRNAAEGRPTPQYILDAYNLYKIPIPPADCTRVAKGAE